jgi:hypothetical protein
LTVAVIFALAVFNPYTERLEGSSPLVYMLSHYSLILSGLVAGSGLLRLRHKLWLFGCAIIFLWHLPLPFALAASQPLFRGTEEFSLLLSGLLVGSSLGSSKGITKGLLFIAWLVGDTLLAILFLIRPEFYASDGLRASPFAPAGFALAGVGMVLFMNAATAYIAYAYIKAIYSRAEGVPS